MLKSGRTFSAMSFVVQSFVIEASVWLVCALVMHLKSLIFLKLSKNNLIHQKVSVDGDNRAHQM